MCPAHKLNKSEYKIYHTVDIFLNIFKIILGETTEIDLMTALGYSSFRSIASRRICK